jgi:hypothetical protein
MPSQGARLRRGDREVVEAAIPEPDRPRYAQAVAEWMEDVPANALSSGLKPDTVLRNVEYLTIEGKLAELGPWGLPLASARHDTQPSPAGRTRHPTRGPD